MATATMRPSSSATHTTRSTTEEDIIPIMNFNTEMALEDLNSQRAELSARVREVNAALDVYLVTARPHDDYAKRLDLIGALARLTARVAIANGRIAAIDAELRDIRSEEARRS